MSSKPAIITYYDYTFLHYAGFFLAGLQVVLAERGIRLKVAKQTPPFFHEQDMKQAGRVNLNGFAVFRFEQADRSFYFCIDMGDDNGSYYKGYACSLPLLRHVDYYFKVNYNYSLLAANESWAAFTEKIFPLEPFFPILPQSLLSFLPPLLPVRQVGWRNVHILKRLKYMRTMPTLAEMRQLRQTSRDLDLFFVVGYYPDPDHDPHNEFRLRLIRLLRQENLNAVTGFVHYTALPPEYAPYALKPFSLPVYLRNLARSRVAVYVRGMHDCLSFKLGQMLCLGKPIVGQTLANNADRLYRLPHFSEQFVCDNPERIVEGVRELLGSPDRMAELSQSNATVFDSELSPSVVVERMLDRMCLK